MYLFLLEIRIVYLDLKANPLQAKLNSGDKQKAFFNLITKKALL